jgi:glucose/arabinose dehydrogenase
LLAIAVAPALAQSPPSGDATRGAQLFQERCSLCHEAGPNAAGGGQGPSLNGVVGRKAATAANFPYTQALRNSNIVWDTQTLDRFLTNPQQLVPGTAMPVSVPEAGARADLIAFLATLSTGPSASAAASPAAGTGQRNLAGDWRKDAPGRMHHIRPEDLPAPFVTPSARNNASVVDRPKHAKLRVPAGFTVELFARELRGPRTIRIAPNGDIFVVETRAGRIRVLRADDGATKPKVNEIFATDLEGPFGIAFYPQGPQPQWLYVANTNSVVRFPYNVGDLHASGKPQVIVAKLADTRGGHTTRDIAFSPDGQRMFVSVGSLSNVATDIPKKTPQEAREWESQQGLGTSWGEETNRADVLVFAPDGSGGRVFASGIRNCVGLGVDPEAGDLWCVTNERDGLGDDLVPDYATRVREGAFYGWPWYYIGSHLDPRHEGERSDLADRVTVPDVLIQSHSAPLGITFYPAADGPAAFPAQYHGDAFVALHGSWNRSVRTGYKVVRVIRHKGVPTGEYEDFLTGFVVDNDSVWGRPVGVAVAHDGALLVSEDGNGTIWRISHGR